MRHQRKPCPGRLASTMATARPREARERAELASSGPPLPWLHSATGAGHGGKPLPEPAPPPHCGSNASAGCGRKTWQRSCATSPQPVAAGARPPLPALASAAWRVSSVLSRPRRPCRPRRLEPSLRLQRSPLLAGLAAAAETSELSLLSGTTQPSSAKQPLLARPEAGLRRRTPDRLREVCPAPRQREGGHAPQPHPSAPPAPRLQPSPPALALRLLRCDATPCLQVGDPGSGPRPETQGGDGSVTDCLSLRDASLGERADGVTLEGAAKRTRAGLWCHLLIVIA